MKTIFPNFSEWLKSSTFFVAPYSRHTIRLYSKICRDFDLFCETEHIDLCAEFSSPHIRKFISTRQDGKLYAKSTVNTRMVTLELIFAFLQEIGMCDENPVIYYRETKTKRRGGSGGHAAIRLPESLSWDEQERLLHASMYDDSFTGYRNSAMIAMILDTGLRTQELIDLDLSASEDYFAGKLKIIGKGNKERLVRFTPRNKEYVSSWLIQRKRRSLLKPFVDNLFVSERGTVMVQQTVYYAIDKLLSKANIKGKQQNGGHLLRHTAASAMLALGVPLKQVQENLGHSSLITTEKYLHLLDKKAS
jgi:site-specific recombinase XerD